VTGCAPSDSVHVLTRRNLPKPVQPGVTYRDVEVAIEISTSLNVVCSPQLLRLLEPRTGAARDSTLLRLCQRSRTPADTGRIRRQ